jgi:hypothetical protein
MGRPRAYKPRHYLKGFTPVSALFFAGAIDSRATGKLWKRGFKHCEDLDLVKDPVLLSIPFVTKRELPALRNWRNVVAQARREGRIP